MIELRHLRTLALLRETGSLTAAAPRLHLTQSALSHQLKELEERLDQPLLIRTARPLRLTRAGQRLAALADRVLPQVDETLAGLRGLLQGQGERLYVAGECHSCLEWLLPRLRAYRARFPEVELDVRLSLQDALPRLQEGTLDVVLTPDQRALPGLAWWSLFDYEIRLAVAADHPLASCRSVTPEQLARETLLAYPVARSRLDLFTRFLWPAGVEPLHVRPVESTTLLVELTALGQGVATLPDWALEEAVDSGRVKALRIGEEGLPGRLYAAMREEEAALPHLTDFLSPG